MTSITRESVEADFVFKRQDLAVPGVLGETMAKLKIFISFITSTGLQKFRFYLNIAIILLRITARSVMENRWINHKVIEYNRFLYSEIVIIANLFDFKLHKVKKYCIASFFRTAHFSINNC
jgi:hypothetical protein